MASRKNSKRRPDVASPVEDPPTISFEEDGPPRPRSGTGDTARITKSGARVVFRERATTRLVSMPHDKIDGGGSLAGAFVKVEAWLRPSEREGFDGQALKQALRERGARAVLLAVRPVVEAPSGEAKRETSDASTPEDAIAAWFDGLPVPTDEREAAKASALRILETGSD